MKKIFGILLASVFFFRCSDDDSCGADYNAKFNDVCYSGLMTSYKSTNVEAFNNESVVIEFRGSSSEGTIILTIETGEKSFDPTTNEVTAVHTEFEEGEVYKKSDGYGTDLTFVNIPTSVSSLEVTITKVVRTGDHEGSLSGTFSYTGTRSSTNQVKEVSGKGSFDHILIPLAIYD